MSRLRRKPFLLPCLSSLKSLSANPQFGSTDFCNISQQQGGLPKEAHAREFFDILNRTVAGRASCGMPLSTSAPGSTWRRGGSVCREAFSGPGFPPSLQGEVPFRRAQGPELAEGLAVVLAKGEPISGFDSFALIHLDQAGPAAAIPPPPFTSWSPKSAPFYFDYFDSPGPPPLPTLSGLQSQQLYFDYFDYFDSPLISRNLGPATARDCGTSLARAFYFDCFDPP
jgi:hypothetical protein